MRLYPSHLLQWWFVAYASLCYIGPDFLMFGLFSTITSWNEGGKKGENVLRPWICCFLPVCFGVFLCSQLCNSFNYELTRWCFIVLEITSIQPPVQCSHVSSAYTENCSFPVIRWRWSDVLLFVGFLSFACFFQKKIIYLLSKQLLLVKLVWRCLQFTQRN